MGGRGSSSQSRGGFGGKRIGGGGAGSMGGASDKREDVQKAFREIGFADVVGTNNIPTATLASYAVKMNELERKYGAIGASENPVFGGFDASDGTLAYVQFSLANPASQSMGINTKVLGNTPENLRTVRSNSQSGWFAPISGRITDTHGYTVTHEYGHMLHNVLVAKQGGTALTRNDRIDAMASEIANIAKTRYGAKGSVSKYGASNSREFFAESFASAHSGAPSAYGKAMNDWLKQQGF